MSYEEAYEMSVEDLIKRWNNWCMEHDREKFVVTPMVKTIKE